MNIREATIRDIPELVALGLRFRSTTGYAAILAENADQMAQTARQLIEQDNGIVFVSEGRDGEVTGMIGMLLFPHHLSGELTAGEVFWFVTPSARGEGVRLMKQAEQWARNHDAHLIQMIQPTGTTVDVIYRRFGYQAVEVAWQKSLVPSQIEGAA